MKIKFEIEINDKFILSALKGNKIINNAEFFENLNSAIILDFKSEILKAFVNKCHEEDLKCNQANELMNQTNKDVTNFLNT